ncbi:anti-sigma factor family protein [Trinickia symbiotica]|uniref:anti-sigma factor family protein n=1 Tax=Trinickia symbiotica TaxID=863227 RepID=UPI00215998E8|nr:anti-sigma factor [Trinickia symbiotica]
MEEDLHAFIDQALDAGRRKEVQDYLDRNPEAAATVAMFAAQRQLLRSALTPIADEPIPERLRVHSLLKHRRSASPAPWRTAATVVLALATGTVGGWHMRGALVPNGGVAVLAGEARSSYMAYATDPSEDTDKAELLKLVSDKLRRPVEIPDLSRAGYRYVGGRLVATGHGSAGLFFYDSADGTRMAVMIRPMIHEKEAPMMEQTTGNVGGVTWAARGLGYSVVGTEAPSLLHPIADEVRRQVSSKSPT